MLRFILGFIFIFSTQLAMTQDEVEVYQKEEGNKILIMGKNNISEEVEVNINIDYKGYRTDDVYPKKVSLKGGEEMVLTTLTAPPATACEYSISLSYKKLKSGNKKITRTTGVQINPMKVNVFTRDGCARCEFVIESFEKNKVVHLELNTTIAPDNMDLMFSKLKEAGYHAKEVQMPVVVYKDKVYYNIDDLKTFVQQFK